MTFFAEIQEWLDAEFVNGFASAVVAWAVYVVIYLFGLRFALKALNKWAQKNAGLMADFTLRSVRVIALIWLIVACANQLKALNGMLTTLLASSGIVAVAIGVAMQSALSNLLSGAMMLIQKPFKMGDTVRMTVQNLTGEVSVITPSHTHLITKEGAEIVVPNSIMTQAILEKKNVVPTPVRPPDTPT